ncbi:MAG TPA: S8 family serine peptidase [Frankiaceae bacterium]|nr:S8 family serine peptidase [Frankiaceae bacterium]
MPTSRVALLALLAVAAVGHAPLAAAAPPSTPTAVVAIVDTGIDPYHPAFKDTSPRAYRHPSTYLPGYPRDAVALRLGKSFAADCARIWRHVRAGKLYWFPGTKIVGAYSTDLVQKDTACKQPATYDVLGHGTMTASRAAGNRYGACPACRIVAVQFQYDYGLVNSREAETSAVAAVSWPAANASWIDAQSNSWGPLPAYDPTGTAGLFAEGAALTRAVEAASRKHLTFWATGNGLGNFGGVLGQPTTVIAHYTPSAIRVGGHDSGQVTLWPGLSPHFVGDACDNWAAVAGTARYEERAGGGTSAATPYVAGGAAAALLHARTLTRDTRTGVRGDVVAKGRRTKAGPLADGVLTLAEWRTVAERTATARPTAQPEDGPPCDVASPYAPLPVRWADVPAAAPAYPLVGWGAVDRAAVARARAVLAGTVPLPARAEEETFFAADRQVREALHTVYRGA